MKKALFLVFCVLTIFCSCDQAPIFYDISQEIKLDDPTITGKVYSIKMVDSVLYAANSNLYEKSVSEKRWKKVSNTPSNIIDIAYAGDYLYVLAEPTSEGTYTVYAHKLNTENTLDKDSSWEEVITGISYLFDNQDFSEANAYCSGKDGDTWQVYDLTESSASPMTGVKSIYGSDSEIKSAVHLKETDYFSSDISMVAVPVGSDGGYIYVRDGKTVKCANDITEVNQYISDSSQPSPFTATSSTKEIITSLSVFDNKLYAGTESGFEVAKLSNDGMLFDFSEPSSNAESSFGTREVLGIWNFDGKDNFFVSVTSTQSSNYDALWGFDSKTEKWNIE